MSTSVLGFFNGVIYNDSSVKIAAITDGTSNTFLFGEHSKGLLYKLDPGYAVSDGCWNSGRWYDTLFATLYPLNPGNGNNTRWRHQERQLLLSHRGGQLAPRRREFRVLRRLGPVHQELDQQLDVQHGQRRQLRRCHARQHDLRHRHRDGSRHQVRQLFVEQPEQHPREARRLSAALDRAGGEVISADAY